MSTALAARPAPGTQPPGTAAPIAPIAGRGLLRRVGGLRHTSPGRLQLLLAALLTLGLLTGLVAGLTGALGRGRHVRSRRPRAAAAGRGRDDLLGAGRRRHHRRAGVPGRRAGAGRAHPPLRRRPRPGHHRADLGGPAHARRAARPPTRSAPCPPAWPATPPWSPRPAPTTGRACRSARPTCRRRPTLNRDRPAAAGAGAVPDRAERGRRPATTTPRAPGGSCCSRS